MDQYRKEIAKKFAVSLRSALKAKYPGVRITAPFVASNFNLRSTTSESISNETARKWLSGVSLPTVHRLYVMTQWLDIKSDYISPLNSDIHTIISTRMDSNPDKINIIKSIDKLDAKQAVIVDQLIRVLLKS
jgi:hypothetical protein